MIDVTLDLPLAPEPAPRPRAAVVGGRARIYTPGRAQAWKAQLAALAQEALPAAVIDEPLRVDWLVMLPRPKRLLRRADPDGLVWAATKPDRDNYDKAILDALAPFWRDDSMVVLGHPLKCYAPKTGRPGLVVRIRSASLYSPTEVAAALGLLPRDLAPPPGGAA